MSEWNRIVSLVKNECANHDHEYGCLPLGGSCPQLNSRAIFEQKGILPCKHFRDCVLPLDKQLHGKLEAQRAGKALQLKRCPICKNLFLPGSNRQMCCMGACEENRRRIMEREKKQRQRAKQVNVPI